MSAKKMIERLIDAYADARGCGQTPLSWTINEAAEIELRMDERVWRSMGPNQTISDMTVCDLPLSIGDDGSDAPFYALKVAEGPDFVPQLDEPSHESSDDRH